MIEKTENKKGDVTIDGSGRDTNRNVHVEQLLMTLDSEQWTSLSRLRKVVYPITLEDKRKLLTEMAIK